MAEPSASIPWMSRPRKRISRDFLADAPLRRTQLEGKRGYFVKVRLTSYRSLPLSCIESVTLRVNGKDVGEHGLLLLLNSDQYRLGELGALGNRWWFILDYGHIFFPCDTDLGAGPVAVEGTLVTVEPYMTAGRFSFTNTSRRSLAVLDAGTAQPI